jgi:hypothetical protein
MFVFTTRYSPLCNDPGRFGVNIKPVHDSRYRLILSEEHVSDIGLNWDNYCYYFETPYSIHPDLLEWYSIIGLQLDLWQSKKENRPKLQYDIMNDGVTITDTRPCSQEEEIHISGEEKDLFCLLNDPIPIDRINLILSSITPKRINSILDNFEELRLIYRENNVVLGLAINK